MVIADGGVQNVLRARHDKLQQSGRCLRFQPTSDSAPGLPVWRAHANGEGQVTAQTTLKSISRTALAAENFELPRGYAEKSMADSMRSPP